MKQQLLALNTWYVSLQQRERLLVLATSTILVITLFYILAWEPVFMGLEQQQQKYDSQRNVLAWMLTASAEAKVLKTSGIRPANKSNQPVSLIVDQSATSAGLKKYGQTRIFRQGRNTRQT